MGMLPKRQEQCAALGLMSRLDQMVQIPGSVDDAMNFNLATTDNVEHKVGFDDQNAIPVFPQFLVMRYPSKQGMLLQCPNSIVKLVDKQTCSVCTVLSDVIKYRYQIVLRTWEVTQRVSSGHEAVYEVSTSFVCG